MIEYRLAEVTAVGNTGISVKFEGESEESGKRYTRLASCNAVVGNRVLMAKVSGSYVVLGVVTR